MNILLIGNGFDLAHQLPTTYNDFLLFLDALRTLSSSDLPSNLNKKIKELIQDNQNKEKIEKIKKLNYKDNLWYQHFYAVKNINNNWCDFEKEIEYITSNLEDIKKSLEKTRRLKGNSTQLLENNFFISAAQQFIFDKYQKANIGLDNYKPQKRVTDIPYPNYLTLDLNCSYEHIAYNVINSGDITIAFEDLLKFIIEQLNEFTKCFELYLNLFVDKLHIQKIKFINDKILQYKNLHVLSFNYTNTLSKYTPNHDFKICFIHGEAKNDENDNLVLGTDEAAERSDPLFTRFKKYFQRTAKGCNSDYYSWIKTINNYTATPVRSVACTNHSDYDSNNNLFIIGHSLTLSDRKILYELITLNNMHTKIYYHTPNSRIELMQNLAAILGQNKFAELTGNKFIEFEEGKFDELLEDK